MAELFRRTDYKELLATVPEAQAGTNTEHAVTPAGLASYFQNPKVAFGHNIELPTTLSLNTGVIFQGVSTFLHTYADPTSNKHNVFLGLAAGNFTLGPGGGAANLGSRNYGFGSYSLLGLTTGYENIGVGYSAGKAITSGYWNSALGSYALYDNTIGHSNTSIGAYALSSNLDGFENTAVGESANTSNTTGDNNCAFGSSTMNCMTIGNKNSAFGAYALYNNITGVQNVALGYGAGYYETGSNKLFIDNSGRGSEADGRAKALIYGVFDADVINQELTFNAGKMGFFGHAATAQPLKANHNNWAALSDVVAALVAIGIFDTA